LQHLQLVGSFVFFFFFVFLLLVVASKVETYNTPCWIGSQWHWMLNVTFVYHLSYKHSLKFWKRIW
jgi:uncharacterized membrane protein